MNRGSAAGAWLLTTVAAEAVASGPTIHTTSYPWSRIRCRGWAGWPARVCSCPHRGEGPRRGGGGQQPPAPRRRRGRATGAGYVPPVRAGRPARGGLQQLRRVSGRGRAAGPAAPRLKRGRAARARDAALRFSAHPRAPLGGSTGCCPGSEKRCRPIPAAATPCIPPSASFPGPACAVHGVPPQP